VHSLDGGDDFVGILGPAEGVWVCVGFGEKSLDCGLEFDDRMEDAAFGPSLCQLGEVAFDGVEPGSRGGGEVQRPARMTGQLLTNLGVLVGGVVVGDGMDELVGRYRRLDGVEEADELLMPVLLHATSCELAVQHDGGGKQRGGAVPDIVVCHRAVTPLLHGQTGLRAIERLDLALFIDRENHSMRRRIHIEPDDVSQLGGKLRIVGEFEQTCSVRLQTVPAPYALHRTDAGALKLGHGSRGPMCGLARRIGQRRGDDTRRNLSLDRRDARRVCLVAQRACDTIGHEAFLPAPDSRLADAGFAHNLRRAAILRRQQYDPRPPDMLLRSVSIRHDRLRLKTIRSTQLNFNASAHPAESHSSEITGIQNRTQMSDSIH
jgi:hypothetical protein